jgi:AcrR family transcriptional regulator
MQEKNIRQSNQARTEATRKALIQASRMLFAEKGYADTGTPEIVKAAAVTRGALYHHFRDKADLFAAAVRAEAEAVANEIEESAVDAPTAAAALAAGGAAYFAAMAAPGRIRLLLFDGPAVLGHAAIRKIDAATGGGALRDGLIAALPKTTDPASVDALADMLSAAFDRAAIAIAAGAAPAAYRESLCLLVDALVGGPKKNPR